MRVSFASGPAPCAVNHKSTRVEVEARSLILLGTASGPVVGAEPPRNENGIKTHEKQRKKKKDPFNLLSRAGQSPATATVSDLRLEVTLLGFLDLRLQPASSALATIQQHSHAHSDC